MFERSSYLHGGLLLAAAATIEAETNAFGDVALNLRQPVQATAMGAYPTIRPDHAFEMIERTLFIVKVGAEKHGYSFDSSE